MLYWFYLMILFWSSLLQPCFKIQLNITHHFPWTWFTQYQFLKSIDCLKCIRLNNIQTVIYIELILMFYKLTYYKKRALKNVTKGKLERLLENFMAIFVFLSYIILGKTEDFGNFTTSHRTEGSLLQKKDVFQTF